VSVTPVNLGLPEDDLGPLLDCPGAVMETADPGSPRALDALAVMRIIVAERAKTLAALRQSESQFHTAFERAPIGMAMVSLEGEWLQVNESLCRIVGYSQAELLARDFHSITHPDDCAAHMAFMGQLIDGTATEYQMIKRYLHKHGQVVWALLCVSLVEAAADKPAYVIAQILDITRRRQAEELLRASEEEYRATFELAGVGKAQADPNTGHFLRVNRKFCQMTGYSADELLGMTFSQITHPDDLGQTFHLNKRLARREIDEFTIDKRYVRKDGQTIWVSLNAAMIRGADGQILRSVATIQDITDRKRAEWVESDRRQVLEMVAQNMPLPGVLDRLAEAVERQVEGVAAFMMVRDGSIWLHAPNLPGDWRDSISAHLMPLAAELSSTAWESPERCGVTEIASNTAWQSLRDPAARLGLQSCWTVTIQSNDGSSLGALAVFSRQSRGPTTRELQMLQMAASLATICVEHHNTASALAYSVRHDLLTGMPNRICFEDRLETAMQRARRGGSQVGLFFIDIDRFKHVNDTFGHEVGDALLQQFATRVAGQVREVDTLARMGGDEFALIIPDISKPEDALTVAEKLMSCLAEPIPIVGRDLIVTSSMGIALYPRDAEDSAGLQRCADHEMYRAKRKGRNGYSIAGKGPVRHASIKEARGSGANRAIARRPH
jgi:diguanylate cyclase (GGDEF)-like protein/PAS domain S-box-containing protein